MRNARMTIWGITKEIKGGIMNRVVTTVISMIILTVSANAQVSWHTYDFRSITNNDSANSLAGENQLSVKVTTDNADSSSYPNGAPYYAFFKIQNSSPVPMVISRIVFDFPNDLSCSGWSLKNQSATNIAMHGPVPAIPLPGYDNIDPPFETELAFVKFLSETHEYGLEPGESQFIQMNFHPVITADYGFDNAINTGNFRIGLYVDGFSNGGYESFVTGPEPVMPISLDIKPQSCPNPLNVKSKGVLPVAILGSDSFDVATIDATSIRLKGVGPIRHSFEDVAAPGLDVADCNCVEDGPDGFVDLTLKFRTQEIVEALGEVEHGDVITLELTGVLFDETPIEGADCILIRGRHKPINPADINKDGEVNAADFAIFTQNWLQSSIVDD